METCSASCVSGIVLAVNPEKKRIFVSLRDRSKDDKDQKKEDGPKIVGLSLFYYSVYVCARMRVCVCEYCNCHLLYDEMLTLERGLF